VSVDALDFADRATGALAGGGAADAEQAAETYTGTLLPDDLYEPWSEEHRRRLEALYARLLHRARRWAELADLDPTNEQAHLELMRRYAAQGDPRAALRQYERLERALHRELGLAPGPEASALRDTLLTGPADSPAACCALGPMRGPPAPRSSAATSRCVSWSNSSSRRGAATARPSSSPGLA